MREVHERTDEGRRHAEARTFGQAQAVVEFFQSAGRAERESDHAAGGVGRAGEFFKIRAAGGVACPENVFDGGMIFEKRDDVGRARVDFFEDGFGGGDFVREARGVAAVERLERGGESTAKLGGVGAGGIDGDQARGEVARAARVFGEAGERYVGVRQHVEVVERGRGSVDEERGAMAATERGDGGNIGRLKERIGGHFGDDARDALAVRSEDALERFEVENIADVNVVAGTGGKFFENRDRIEVEPTELEPDRAAAGSLQIGDGAKGRVDGAHAAVGEKKIGVGHGCDRGGVAGVERAGEVAANLSGRIAGERGFGINRRTQFEAHEVILGFTRRDEAPEVLQVGFSESGERRRGGWMSDAVQTVRIDEQLYARMG